MRALFLLSFLVVASCRPTPPRQAPSPEQLSSTAWPEIVERARGSEVSFAMWAGDEDRNRYFRGVVADALQQRYGIKLRIAPFNDTAEIINKLHTEKRAGRVMDGSIDMVWINGENFRSARQAGVLWGPFADKLPNIRHYPDSARRADFGTPTEGFEAPWQRSQFVFAYDTARVAQPPRDLEALQAWIEAHPGRFTYVAPPDFTGSAFIRHVLLRQGAPDKLDERHYAVASEAAIEYLKGIRPYLWRRGETYPATTRELDRLFANQQVDFSMSYGPSFASVRIERGEFSSSTRTFVFDSGTLSNYNYLAIPFNASNIPGALVVIDHFLSFDQLLDLSRVLKSPFPLDLSKLTAGQRQSVAKLPRGPATLPDEELSSHAIPEPHAEYLIRFEKDWRAKVLRD